MGSRLLPPRRRSSREMVETLGVASKCMEGPQPSLCHEDETSTGPVLRLTRRLQDWSEVFQAVLCFCAVMLFAYIMHERGRSVVPLCFVAFLLFHAEGCCRA